jgi:cobalt/nickel transport system ATP-binding protein
VLDKWLLELIDITYTYPGEKQPALRGLSMKVPKGKKGALIGHNGCGKSTLFLHANGLLRPKSGKVLWKGKTLKYDRHSLREIRQQIGLVFQDPEQQLVAATVEEDLSYGLYNLGIGDAEVKQQLGQVLADFELEELAQKPIHHLSLGQKKWVSLAGVMALKPSLLILDEPTAYLDPFQAKQLLKEIERIYRSGTTILMATHDIDLVLSWADWVFVMHNGQIVLEGEPAKVFGEKELLVRFKLGIPLLVELWSLFPKELRQGNVMPRNAQEFYQWLNRYFDT